MRKQALGSTPRPVLKCSILKEKGVLIWNKLKKIVFR
jgi:hypothetical protein